MVRRFALFASLSVVSLIGLVGCDGSDGGDARGERAAIDLVAAMRPAGVGVVRPRIALADPEPAARLVDGWATATGDGVWALGPRAELELFVGGDAPLELRLDCRAVALPPGEPQRMTVRTLGPDGPIDLASVDLASVEAVSGEADVETEPPMIVLPRLEPGWNRVQLDASRWHDPRAPAEGIDDARPLAALCRSLELRAVESAGASRPDPVAPLGTSRPPTVAEDGSLILPVGSGARFFVDVPAGGALELRDVETRAAEVVVRVEHASDRAIQTARIRSGARHLDLGLDVADQVRVEVVAVPAEPRLLERFIDRDEPSEARIGRLLVTAPEEVAETASADGVERLWSERSERSERPNVVIYLIDTLRADHLGLYGYARDTSPALERLAEDGIVFLEARAQTSWTRTAVASIMTGRLPSGHGVDDRDDVLPAELPTLAESLSAAGWTSVGVTTNGNVGPDFGFAQGFEAYQHLRESLRRPEVHRLADDLGAWVDTWLGGFLGPEAPPFFLYAHATDPHAPYTPREPFASRFAPGAERRVGELATLRALVDGDLSLSEDERRMMVDLYDAEVAFVDHHLGLLMDDLRARGVYDDTLVVVVSDHGEEFGDHGGWEHGRTLYEEQLRVPLVVKLPRGAGAGLRLEGRADHIDLLPTVLDVVGLEVPVGVDGTSLVPAILAAAGDASSDRAPSDGAPSDPWRERGPSIAELRLQGYALSSLVDGSNKLIVDDDARMIRRPRLFDLAADPGEHDDCAGESSVEVGVLEERLRRATEDASGRRPAGEETVLDEETRKQLEALGYVQ